MEKYCNFYNINKDGSEDVNYDIPEMPVYIRDGNLSSLKDLSFKAHYHSDWEFITVLNGEMKYSINGKVISLLKGESLFINSNYIHFGFSDTGEDCDYICMLIHPLLLCINPYIERNYISPICNDSHQYLIFKNAERKITDTIVKIYAKKQEKGKNFYFEVQQYLFSLAADLYSAIDKLPQADTGTQNFARIKAMMDFISNNYPEKIALSDIAKSANVCNNSCIAIFKKFTDSTPIEYLINYRIDKAVNLLNTTEKQISEIALDCGFSGSSYFTEMFKRNTGITPKEYRKNKTKKQ